MADGVLQTEPLDVSVSQGSIHLRTRLRLTDPLELTLPAGPLARKIQIDTAMCGAALKFIAPVMANATSAKGAFSIDLDGCSIPLSAPVAKGEMAGRLTIHSVELGPGPMTNELAVFLARQAPAQLRQESVVQFRMTDGKIYHQGLELIFPDFTLRSKGYVGLEDQSVKIMVELPVPPKWLANNPLATQSMRNQVLNVPIAGTLSQPKLDQAVMQNLTRQFVQKAAGSLIESELGQQVNRLFGSPK